MNKRAVTQAQMMRMRRALERDGLSFAGYRSYPDGSVVALVTAPEPLTPPSDTPPSSQSIDAEIDDWAAKHGYG